MAIKHQKTAIPDVDKVNCIDWNADHTGTATPDNHGNEAHTPDFQQILPIGFVNMYNGTGIANVATRTVQLGDEPGDTITLDGWFVCNGLAGTPNILNKFIRSMSASGNTGGSDDALAHTHAFTQPSNHSNHVFTQPSSHAATACSRTTDVALTNNHSVTQPSSHAATACSRTTDVALTNNHAGTAVGSHGLHTHEPFPFGRTAGYLHPATPTSGTASYGLRATLAAGTYLNIPIMVLPDAAISAHSVTQPSAHAITQPTFNTPILSHSGTAVAAHAITQPTFDTPILSHSGGAVDAHSAHAGGAVGAVNENLTNANMPAYYSLIFIIRIS